MNTQNTQPQNIVGLGEILWDMLPEGKKLGGAPANFAYHASQFGFNSLVISAIGNDEPGQEIVQILKENRVNHILPLSDHETGTVLVTLEEGGIPSYEIKKEVAWDYIPCSDELLELAANTHAVCFGSLAQRNEVSRKTILRFLDAMPDQPDRLKIFDINLRQNFYNREVITESLKRCNILKINDEELVIVSHLFGYKGTDLHEKCRRLMDDFALQMLILTCGTNGSYVFTPEVHSFRETPKVKVGDTVGAGDSFTATFCAAILNGKSIFDAHEAAVEVSAYICTQHGAMVQLPPVFLERF